MVVFRVVDGVIKDIRTDIDVKLREPEAIFAYMKEHTPPSKDHRLYFDYGTKTLDQFYPQYAETVNKIYTDNGYDSTNFVNRLFEGADHSENSWNQRLDISFIFLLGK
jgi:hypothetical protein